MPTKSVGFPGCQETILTKSGTFPEYQETMLTKSGTFPEYQETMLTKSGSFAASRFCSRYSQEDFRDIYLQYFCGRMGVNCKICN